MYLFYSLFGQIANIHFENKPQHLIPQKMAFKMFLIPFKGQIFTKLIYNLLIFFKTMWTP